MEGYFFEWRNEIPTEKDDTTDLQKKIIEDLGKLKLI